MSDCSRKKRWIRNVTHRTVLLVELEQVIWVRRLARNGGARALRQAAGVSASEVARDLNVTPGAVSRWERGLRVPRGVTAERWAELLRRLSSQ